MQMKIRTVLFISFTLVLACCTKKNTTQGGSGTIPPEKTLIITFYPSWGGSSEAILERKKGTDKLFSTYHQKVEGRDTILTNTEIISKTAADSIYALAEQVVWNDDANYGTAVPRVGLKYDMSFQKGRNRKSIHWENLINASELPQDLQRVNRAVNALAPVDFKLY